MDRGAWRATVPGVAKSQKPLSTISLPNKQASPILKDKLFHVLNSNAPKLSFSLFLCFVLCLAMFSTPFSLFRNYLSSKLKTNVIPSMRHQLSVLTLLRTFIAIDI